MRHAPGVISDRGLSHLPHKQHTNAGISVPTGLTFVCGTQATLLLQDLENRLEVLHKNPYHKPASLKHPATHNNRLVSRACIHGVYKGTKRSGCYDSMNQSGVPAESFDSKPYSNLLQQAILQSAKKQTSGLQRPLIRLARPLQSSITNLALGL